MSTRSTSTHDVIVVGARAGGASTAMLLARAGLDVLVVDRSRYGADTLSTHALMRAGVVLLDRWGLLDRVIDAGTPAIRRTTFSFAEQDVAIAIDPGSGVDALYAPRRTVLDPILVDAARSAGAKVQFGTSVTGVTRDHTGRVDGVTARDGSGRAVLHSARWIVGADGVRSIVADAVGAPVERHGTGVTATVYGYWPEFDTDGYQWAFRSGEVAGVIPTNDGQANIFAVASPSRVGRGGLPVLHEIVHTAAPALAERLRDAHAPRGVRTFGGLAGFVRVPYGPGWALVGDAGYWKDPISAHGLTDALRDAALLARAIAGTASGELREDDAFARYHQTRNRMSLQLFDVVDTIAKMRWTDAEIPHLLRQLSASTVDEVDFASTVDEVDMASTVDEVDMASTEAAGFSASPAALRVA